MKIEGIEVDINITDNSAKEFSQELITQLENVYNKMSTHAMSEYTLILQGKKQMLGEVINYLKYTIWKFII